MIKLEKVFSFSQREDLLEASTRSKKENPYKPELPSKYAKVLSCCFVNTAEDTSLVKRAEFE